MVGSVSLFYRIRGMCMKAEGTGREATVRPARAMAAVDYGHSGCPGGQPTGCVYRIGRLLRLPSWPTGV